MGGSIAAHRAEQTRRLFESFRTLLYERGYDAISLADIAEHAGLARTAMYHYFSDKESLLTAYTASETEEFLEALDGELRAIDNPVEQLRAFVRLQVEYFTESHLPPGPTLRLLVPEPAATEIIGHIAALEARLHQILRVGRDRRYFLVDDVDASVAMITACVSRGAVVDPGRSPAESVAATEAFVLRALGARLTADGRPRQIPRR
ncbi:MAG: TetR/AcrR family transcriptional regulator [Acidimicrobiales bacterium]